MKEKKQRIEEILTDHNIVKIVGCSIFLPYILTMIVLMIITIYIICKPKTRKLIFIHKGSKTLRIFGIVALIVPVFYKNWTGVLVGVGVMMALILGMFLRSVMTRTIYEEVLDLICVLSLVSTSCAISERFIIPLFNSDYFTYRISAMFFYPNYFGTIVGMVIIICAYKVLTRQGNMWTYYGIAGMNVISVYLCQSMFVWVEVFLGVAVLLILLKKHRLLSLWLVSAAIGVFTIFVLEINLIPRLSDAELTTKLRIKIWTLSWEQIKTNPLFGRGFMTVLHTYKASYSIYLVTHAHSLFLDIIVNFGIVGTVFFLRYFIKYYEAVVKFCCQRKEMPIHTLILAISVATFAHGLMDVTILWIQTLPLFLLILSGLGAYEKTNENLIPLDKWYDNIESCA